MPLKHHTETAYMLVLALVTCVTGFLIALLPALPVAFPYWLILFVLTFFYPIFLARTFKSNRADYEFRMLHWFPCGMILLWMVLQFLAPRARLFYILQLGFFFLWSLPLVALGIAFLILFAVHVIRRSRVRILFLSVFLILFTAGAVASEAMGWDPKMQGVLYAEHPKMMQGITEGYRSLRATVAAVTGTGDMSDTANNSSSAMSEILSSSRRSRVTAQTSSENASAALASSRPAHLPESGPEVFAVLAATLLALYMGTVHLRARTRVS